MTRPTTASGSPAAPAPDPGAAADGRTLRVHRFGTPTGPFRPRGFPVNPALQPVHDHPRRRIGHLGVEQAAQDIAQHILGDAEELVQPLLATQVPRGREVRQELAHQGRNGVAGDDIDVVGGIPNLAVRQHRVGCQDRQVRFDLDAGFPQLGVQPRGRVPFQTEMQPWLIKTLEGGRSRELCDQIWVVASDEALKLERLQATRGMSEQDGLARLANQSSQEWKMQQADRVITSTGSM